MSRHYKIDDKKLASVTTIISDCTDKSPALTQWAANMVCQHIRDNVSWIDPGGYYELVEADLERARFNYKEISRDALDVGSAVHNAIEYYLNTGKEPEWLK